MDENKDASEKCVKECLDRLRSAVVREKEERTNAPFEAKRAAEQRIAEAHELTVIWAHEAHKAGATKTMIAEQLGIKNLNRVGQLINEGKSIEGVTI